MANGDNPLPQMQLDPNAFPISASAPQPQPAPAPAPPQPSTATPPSPTANTASSLAPTPIGTAPSPGAEALPQPYQFGGAARGGAVKNVLTRAFYGMGQAMLAHVGLPTDYDIQRTTYQQALQANEQQLRQAQFNWQQSQVPVMTPYGLMNMPLAVAQKMGPAWAQALGKEDVARINLQRQSVNQRFAGAIQDAYDQGRDISTDPLVQAFAAAQMQSRPGEMQQYIYNYMQKNGLPMSPQNWMEGYNNFVLSKKLPTETIQVDPTGLITKTTRQVSGAVPTAAPTTPVPTGVASGPLTEAEAARLAQFGMYAKPGTMPIAATPSAPAPTGGLPPIPQPVQSPLLPGPPGTAAPAPAAPPAGAAPTPGLTAGGGTLTAAQRTVLATYPPTTAVYDMANQMVEGDLSPSQAKARGAQYAVALQLAGALSQQRYGKPFDAANADIAYNYARQASTQNTLKYLNSLTGADNKGGNLQKLVDMSNSPELARTQFPPLNDAIGWARMRAGNPTQAAYAATALEVADQVGKILQGGPQGTSDTKLKQAQSLFQTGFTPEQMNAVATSLRGLLANRKTELIGDNRYLQRQFGQAGATTHPGTTTPDFFQRFGGAPR